VSGTRRAIVLGALPLSLAACAQGGTTGGGPAGDAAAGAQLKKGATIQWAVDEGATRTPLREDQVTLFKQQFPDLNVDYILGSTSTEKVQALFAAGTPPDLFRQETSGMAFFASKGQLAALDPMMRRDKYDLADFFPTAWELWKWKGKYYGMPFLGIRIGYFNRALAQQSGAKIPTTWKDPAWTFQAFLEAAQRATVRSGTTASRWGADMSAANARRDWQPWVWNNGGDLFNASGTKVEFDQPPAVEALEFLVDLMHKHRVAPTPQELQSANRATLFQGGNLLMYHEPVNNVAANRRNASFDWSLFGLPKGKAKTVSASGGGVGWFLTGTSNVKDETWELLKVLASKESVRMEAVRGEAPPSRRSIANEPAFINPAEPPKGDMKVVVEALEAMHVEQALINGVEIDRILSEELTPVWRGEKPLREAIANAANRARPLVNPEG
jgi:multiple sugar transport system substrate-binding protein